VRREARARRALAADILPAAKGPPEGIHIWLDLPPQWSPAQLHLTAQARGLSLVTADAFAVGDVEPPAGVRISLGGPAKQAVLAEALKGLAELARGETRAGGLVV